MTYHLITCTHCFWLRSRPQAIDKRDIITSHLFFVDRYVHPQQLPLVFREQVSIGPAMHHNLLSIATLAQNSLYALLFQDFHISLN